jgi:serine/threonine protein kinase
MTKKVVTLWYRPPELLIESRNYTKSIDAWSVGCILGELLKNGVPMFQGNTEIEQFRVICEVIGFPTKEDWPEFFTDTSK